MESAGWTPPSGQIDNYFFIYFCNAEFDRSAHAGIGENRKLLGDNKRTTPTPEVERPVYTTVEGANFRLLPRPDSWDFLAVVQKRFF